MSERDLDRLYKQANDEDPARPSSAVRQVILDRASRLAAERGTRQESRSIKLAHLRWQLWGPLIAGALATIILVPLVPLLRSSPPASPSLSSDASSSAPSGLGVAQTEPLREYAPAPQAAPPMPAAPPGSSAGHAVAAAKVAPPLSEASANAARPPQAFPAAPAPVPQFNAARSQLGQTASAERLQSSEAADALASSKAVTSELQRAAAEDNVARLMSLLQQASPIDARDADGRTALMLATLRRHADIVRILLDHGADPSIPDANGRTPLDVARERHDAPILSALTRAMRH